MRALRAVGFVVGMCLLPVTATAGPIPFLVGIESMAQPDGNGGAGNFSIVDPGNRPAEATPPAGPLPLVNLRLTPKAPADPGWEIGTARPVVGVTPFSIGLTFTDGLSGEKGSVQVTGSARSEWLHEAEGPFSLTGAWIEFDPILDDLVLGVNRYEVFASGASGTNGELAGSVTFLVDLDSDPVPLPPETPPPPASGIDTPEPGTAILAGLGLLSAGALAQRRRRAA